MRVTDLMRTSSPRPSLRLRRLGLVAGVPTPLAHAAGRGMAEPVCVRTLRGGNEAGDAMPERSFAPPMVRVGAQSPVLDRDVAERMARELPRGRFVEIPRAVHTLHADNPEAVLGALQEFLGF